MSRFGHLEFEGHLEHPPRETGAVADEAACLQAAQAAFEQAGFEQALRWFAKAIEYNPQSSVAWAGQARMLIELGEFTEAKLWVDKALERFPRNAELLAAKAVALARTGDVRAALAFSDAALQERDDTPYLWLARGDVLLAGEEKRADYCFTRALALAPQHWLWPWLASRIHYFYERFSLALKYVSQALELDATRSAVWLQMGRCQLALGMAGPARNACEQARHLDPRAPDLAALAAGVREPGLWSRVTGLWRRYRRR